MLATIDGWVLRCHRCFGSDKAIHNFLNVPDIFGIASFQFNLLIKFEDHSISAPLDLTRSLSLVRRSWLWRHWLCQRYSYHGHCNVILSFMQVRVAEPKTFTRPCEDASLQLFHSHITPIRQLPLIIVVLYYRLPCGAIDNIQQIKNQSPFPPIAIINALIRKVTTKLKQNVVNDKCFTK